VAVWIWAWSSKRHKEFEEAARLPLDEQRPGADGNDNGESR
jgi:cbb3-type cytochrome oxidase subunit 3